MQRLGTERTPRLELATTHIDAPRISELAVPRKSMYTFPLSLDPRPPLDSPKRVVDASQEIGASDGAFVTRTFQSYGNIHIFSNRRKPMNHQKTQIPVRSKLPICVQPGRVNVRCHNTTTTDR